MLNKMLNIKYPIIQGAMANIATAEFAACVSNCGGLGIAYASKPLMINGKMLMVKKFRVLIGFLEVIQM